MAARVKVSPRRIGPKGTITLAGTVSGPIPKGGVIVELLVRYRGMWEPFRAPRTNASVQFHLSYHFQGAVGRFPFRAEVPGGQASFPYGAGRSAAVTVTERRNRVLQRPVGREPTKHAGRSATQIEICARNARRR